MNKIGIVGFGNVGLAIVHEICTLNMSMEIVVIDHNEKRVLANIDDFNHMLSNTEIKLGKYSDIDDCDAIIIAASVKMNSNRTIFLQESYQMISEIMDSINQTSFNGIIIVVSNPNDVLTTYVSKNYHLQNKVIGTGCMLDINRLKFLLGKKNVNGIIIGEHGESQKIIWETFGKSVHNKEKLQKDVINAASFIVDGKGYTNYGVASCVVDLMKRIFSNRKFDLVASFYDGEKNVAYSYPLVCEDSVFKVNPKFHYDGETASFVNKIRKEYEIFANGKTIGIDLDDTITDIQDEMKKYAAVFDAENNGHGIINSDKYLVGEMYGWSSEMRDKFFITYRKEIVKNAKVRNGAVKNLKNWQKNGYKIVIITARNSKYYDNPYDDTYKWLKKHHIPFDELFINSGNKKDICKELNVDYFIDDMPDNCNLVNEIPNIKVFIMDNGNNYTDDENIIRVKSFKEISEVISNVQEY